MLPCLGCEWKKGKYIPHGRILVRVYKRSPFLDSRNIPHPQTSLRSPRFSIPFVRAMNFNPTRQGQDFLGILFIRFYAPLTTTYAFVRAQTRAFERSMSSKSLRKAGLGLIIFSKGRVWSHLKINLKKIDNLDRIDNYLPCFGILTDDQNLGYPLHDV